MIQQVIIPSLESDLCGKKSCSYCHRYVPISRNLLVRSFCFKKLSKALHQALKFPNLRSFFPTRQADLIRYPGPSVGHYCTICVLYKSLLWWLVFETLAVRILPVKRDLVMKRAPSEAERSGPALLITAFFERNGF